MVLFILVSYIVELFEGVNLSLDEPCQECLFQWWQTRRRWNFL